MQSHLSGQPINFKKLARQISIVENELQGYRDLLRQLSFKSSTPVIGLTGPPGAGKSTLLNALLTELNAEEKKIGVIAVDPTSPFNFGALLGDRIRLSQFYNNPNVYIRSLATRGSLGGLSEKIIEVVDVLRGAGFDYIFVETVGVGQSEVEIAGLADTTIVVLVPEAGDEIQTMKAGLMEIANIFVVNKSDRPESGHFVQNLKKLTHSKPLDNGWSIPVLPTIATKQEGISELLETIQAHHQSNQSSDRKPYLLAKKTLFLIQRHRLQDVDEQLLFAELKKEHQKEGFNLYAFAEKWF